MKPIFFLLLAIGSCSQLAAQKAGQLDPLALYNKHQARLMAKAANMRDPATDPNAFAWAVIASSSQDPRQNAALHKAACIQSQDRVAQQVGAPAGALGSTTLTDKSDIPEVLAAAFESGGVTRTVSGNAVTFAVNGDGIYKFLAGQDLCVHDDWGLRDFSAFATFQTSDPGKQSATAIDPTTGKDQKITFLPDPHTLNAAGLQWAINNPRDPSNVAETQDFVAAIMDAIDSMPQSELLPILERVRTHQDFQAHLKTATVLAADATEEARKSAVQETANAALQVDPFLHLRLAATAARSLAPKRRFSLANSGLAFSVKYSYNKPYNQHALHNAKAIVSYTPQNKQVVVTGNFGADVFGDGPQSGLRDIQASVSAVRPIPAISSMPANVSLSAYFQYQKENALLVFPSGNNVQGITLPGSASTLLAPKGNIFIVQALLTLTKSNTAIVPIGFTYSNRTELLTGSEVKGHVGIQFNGLKDLFNGSTPK